MVSAAHIEQNARFLAEDFPAARLCFFGHSHEQKIYELDGEAVRERPVAPSVPLARDRVYFINPGSVDASRKRAHKLAEAAVLDTDAWRVEFLALPYDCASSEAKAAAFGYRLSPCLDYFYKLQRRLLRITARRTVRRPV
jgi:predicted phosphodiesterase